jgi:hypothetical protein
VVTVQNDNGKTEATLQKVTRKKGKIAFDNPE